MSTLIIVTYTSIDRCRVTRRYRTLDGARAFAQEYVGRYPSIGSSYAVSDDGIGKVTVRGASLADLFPVTVEDDAPAASVEDYNQRIRDLDGDRERQTWTDLSF